MEVKDKVVIITGASYGIGMSTAKLFSEKGAKLVLTARSKDLLEKLAKALPDSIAIVADMSDPASIKKMLEKAYKHFGRIDILINNAGQGYDEEVEKIDLSKMNYVYALNLIGPIVAMQQVIPIMRKQGGGAIVNISSGLSKMYMPSMSVYAGLKAALNNISLTARAELEKDKIIVSVVLPYITFTEFHKNTQKFSGNAEQNEDWENRDIPPGDPPEKVAQAILEAVETGKPEIVLNPWITRAGQK